MKDDEDIQMNSQNGDSDDDVFQYEKNYYSDSAIKNYEL